MCYQQVTTFAYNMMLTIGKYKNSSEAYIIDRVASFILFLHVASINSKLNNNINIFYNLQLNLDVNWKKLIIFSAFMLIWYILYSYVLFILKNSYFDMCLIFFFIATNIKIKSQLSRHEITMNTHHMIDKDSIICQIVFNHLCYCYKSNLKIDKSCQNTNCSTSSNQTDNIINECNIKSQNSMTSLVCFN